MAGESVLTKKPRLDKSSGESSSASTRRELRKYDPYDDEYIRQYLLYYYQFHKSEGFVIDWDNLDYRLLTYFLCIQGSRIEFVDHVSASYRCCAGILYWVTFWAKDLASSNPEPRLYQTNVRLCGPTFCEMLIFRLKPTDEEIAAIQVDPPPPLFDGNPELPTILFTVTGPGSGSMSIPEVSFTRIPAEVEPTVWSPYV
ncbi:PREDICTED: uncharacterized protein LOC104728951 [Camelina sativa]|uniref:Uncharacterized protein LOC104728951 n=1 Tax=Camelina sativa TaxID=90675 RepID=A0ABM1QLM2_CAMSA|nr:PREDICTED: uncharacterized protein LOC104728951 [Camelina sativa]